MFGRFLLFCMALLTTGPAPGARLCSIDVCTNWIIKEWVDFGTTYGCTNVSGMVYFEVWGACDPAAGVGDQANPVIQSKPGIKLATQQAGKYCYCRLKSVNGGANLPASNLWIKVFNAGYTDSYECARNCGPHCAHAAQDHPQLRVSLFSAAGLSY